MKTYFTFMKESYTLYHPSYTSAINAALQKHSDLNVSDEDRDTHIAMGPRKPAEGETVKHHIPATDKNGDKHMIHIQVYNKGGNKPFELNTYSSKVSKKKVAEETVDVSEGLASTLGNVVKRTFNVAKPVAIGAAKRAFNVAKPVAIGAAKLTVKKVVKPAAKHVFNVVKHGVLRSILEDPTEMRHSSDSLGDHMALKAYANSLGPKHADRHDLLTAASHMAFGNMDHLKKHLNAMDTDVRDKIKEYMKEEVEQTNLGGGKGPIGGRYGMPPGTTETNPVTQTIQAALKKRQSNKITQANRLTKEQMDLDEANSHREVDDLKSKGNYHKAGQHAAKSGHPRQYGVHFGMRSGKEEAQRQFLMGYDSVNKTNEEVEKARKAGMAKVSTTKDIGYKVVDVGPGQKETVRKMHNFKEQEVEPLAEISAALAMRASIEAAKKVGMGLPMDTNSKDKLIRIQKIADEKFRKMLGRSSSAKVATTPEE